MTRLPRESEFAQPDSGGGGKARLPERASELIRELAELLVEERDLPIDWIVLRASSMLRAAHGAAIDDRKLAAAEAKRVAISKELRGGRERAVKSNATKKAARAKRKSEG